MEHLIYWLPLPVQASPRGFDFKVKIRCDCHRHLAAFQRVVKDIIWDLEFQFINHLDIFISLSIDKDFVSLAGVFANHNLKRSLPRHRHLDASFDGDEHPFVENLTEFLFPVAVGDSDAQSACRKGFRI